MGNIGKETDALLVEIPFVLAFDRFDLLSLLLLGTPHPVIQTDSDYDKRQYHVTCQSTFRPEKRRLDTNPEFRLIRIPLHVAVANLHPKTIFSGTQVIVVDRSVPAIGHGPMIVESVESVTVAAISRKEVGWRNETESHRGLAVRQRDLPGVFDRNRKRRASVFRMGYRQSVKRKSGDYDRIEVQVAHDVMGGGERTYTIGRTQHDAPVGSEDTRIGHKLFGVKPVGARITFQLSSCGIKDDQPPVRRDPESVVFRDDPLNDLTGQRQGFMANETVFFVITAKSVTVGSDPQPVRAVDGKRVDRIAADRRRVVGIVPVVLQEVGTGIVGVEAVFVRRDPKTASMILRNV